MLGGDPDQDPDQPAAGWRRLGWGVLLLPCLAALRALLASRAFRSLLARRRWAMLRSQA